MPSALEARAVIRPAFLWVPECAAGSYGDEAAELAVQLGQQVDEEERIALRAMMPIQDSGMPAGLESCTVAGRQNVKSWAAEMALIHDAWVTKVGRCFWSAHQTKTADDNFDHLCMLVESFDWLLKRTKRVYRGNGDHRILFRDGRSIEFGARENGPTGRGRVRINRLTLDEWLYGTAAMQGALIPAMGAAGDRYVRYLSSPGRLGSESLRRLRERGRPLNDPSLAWCEWTSERLVDGRRVQPPCQSRHCSHVAGQVTGCRLDDPEIIQANNPALGRRITWEFVRQERLALTPTEFGRERAGLWEDPVADTDDPPLFPKWQQCLLDGEAGTEVLGRPALAIDTSWDRQTTWIAAASPTQLGYRVELVSSGPGTDWVRGWLLEDDKHAAPGLDAVPPRIARPVAVALQGSGAPVSGLADELLADELGQGLPEAYRGKVRRLNGAEMAKSGAKVYDLVDKGQIEVVSHERLTASVASRPMGDGWVIDRRASKADAAPIVAICAAVWALITRPAEQDDDDYDVLDSIG